METDIASEELVKFLLPQGMMSHGENDVFSVCSPTPDSVENLSDSGHRVPSSSFEGIPENLKLESPDTDILNIATTQVGLGAPIDVRGTVVDPLPVNRNSLSGSGLHLNQPIFILNNHIPTTLQGISLSPQRNLFLVVDKNGLPAFSVEHSNTSVLVSSDQLVTQDAETVKTEVRESSVLNEIHESSEEEGEDSPPPFDYSIFLNKLPPKPTNNSSILFQLVGDDGPMKNSSPIEEEEEEVVTEVDDSEKGVPVNNTEDISSNPDGQFFKCDLCTATFNRKGNFTRHRLVHTVNAKEAFRYKCEECSRQFLQKCDLNRHMHIHNKTEPHRCTICDKGYIRSKDLMVHMKFHNRDKSMICPHCDKGFYQTGDLNRHIRCVHLKARGLTCGHCRKKYAKEATLIRHMQTHHRDIILQSLDEISVKKGVANQVESNAKSLGSATVAGDITRSTNTTSKKEAVVTTSKKEAVVKVPLDSVK